VYYHKSIYLFDHITPIIIKLNFLNFKETLYLKCLKFYQFHIRIHLFLVKAIQVKCYFTNLIIYVNLKKFIITLY
jgi:hypothetical protein